MSLYHFMKKYRINLTDEMLEDLKLMVQYERANAERTEHELLSGKGEMGQ